jgi:transcriptional regulator with XRE-family HTH domain
VTPEEIRALRRSLGLNQRAFARQVGAVTPSTISQWENGRKQPRNVHVATMRALGADPEPAQERLQVRLNRLLTVLAERTRRPCPNCGFKILPPPPPPPPVPFDTRLGYT